MSCGVYMLSTPNGNRYVGSSHVIEKRYRDHKQEARRGKHYNPAMQRAFNKYGDLALTVLEECSPEVRLEREQHYLDVLRPELNASGLASGVEYTNDVRARIAAGWTDERRARTRQAMLGNKRCVGRVDTIETRRMRSEALKGRAKTPNHCAAISEGKLKANTRKRLHREQD